MFGALLRIPFQAINRRIQSNLAAAGFDDLRPAHFSVFQHLPEDGTRLTRLAEDAQMTKQSMGELVRYLEAAGYLKRVPDPDDGRARIIQRTDAGWDVEKIARRSIRDQVQEWGSRLGPERFDQCRSTLSELADLIEFDQQWT